MQPSSGLDIGRDFSSQGMLLNPGLCSETPLAFGAGSKATPLRALNVGFRPSALGNRNRG